MYQLSRVFISIQFLRVEYSELVKICVRQTVYENKFFRYTKTSFSGKTSFNFDNFFYGKRYAYECIFTNYYLQLVASKYVW